MVDIIDSIVFIFCGALGVMLADWTHRLYVQRKQKSDQLKISRVLAAHGMSSHLYLPSLGSKDIELVDALEKTAMSGRIVLDAEGTLVGKVLPYISKNDKGTGLRLVVDNTKSSE